MTDPTADFFESLADRADPAMLARWTGSVRLDLEKDGEVDHWIVRLTRGTLTVTRSEGTAEAVIRTSRAVFDGLVTGRLNVVPAILRGDVRIDGDLALLTRFQRLFPGAPPLDSGASDRSIARQRS